MDTDPLVFFANDLDKMIQRHRAENDISIAAAIGALRIAAAVLEAEASGGELHMDLFVGRDESEEEEDELTGDEWKHE